MTNKTLSILATLPALSSVLVAQFTPDGQNIPSSGLTLRLTQDSPTQFGDATGGTQSSTGGSELNQLFADFDAVNGDLNIGITGNLEANFNKFWIFFDAVPGGQNVLTDSNADAGFGEINALAGLTFGPSFTADHGLRFEVGTGFVGMNGFDLIEGTASQLYTGGGPGDLPVANVGSGGVTLGWDNSNSVGVTNISADVAADAATATTGWELSIRVGEFFGGSQNVSMVAFITNGDGNSMSNQALPGLGLAANAGAPADVTLPDSFSVAVPEPSAAAAITLLALAGLVTANRRR